MTPAESLALVQRSPEWYAACVGSVGASRVHDIIAEGKAGALSAGRKNLMGGDKLQRIFANIRG